jgi:hypothetical protein
MIGAGVHVMLTALKLYHVMFHFGTGCYITMGVYNAKTDTILSYILAY